VLDWALVPESLEAGITSEVVDMISDAEHGSEKTTRQNEKICIATSRNVISGCASCAVSKILKTGTYGYDLKID
jgi:hypothetical protein